MRWKSPDGQPLRELPLRTGDWWHSPRFDEVATAHDWHLKPSEFQTASESDQAYMAAYTRARGNMIAWERQLQAEEAERRNKS